MMKETAVEKNMKHYDAYKDSGVEWLGEIPEHWEVQPLKYLTKYFKGFAFSSIDFSEKGIPIVKASNIKNGIIKNITSFITLDNQKNRFQNFKLNEGDIIISTVGSKPEIKDSAVGQLAIVSNDFAGSYLNQNTVCLRATDSIVYKSFLKNIFLSNYIRSNFDRISLWIANQAYIEVKNILDISVAFPPIPEQTKIAQFLDDKTTKIDDAIAIKEQQIQLLKERKQILIHKAVTQGLNPNVKLKDSGVEWIGKIPEGWEVKRLKNFIINLESGVSVNASEAESANVNEIGVLKTSCVYNYIFEFEQNKKVERRDLKRVSCPVVQNRIIISRMNAPELVGASGLVKESYPNLFLPDRLWQTVFDQKEEFDVVWLSQVLITKRFRDCITMIATGSSPSMKNITKGDFLNLRLASPSFSEQKEISEYIETASQKIETAISLKQQEIEKLKEYKSSLINGVVTGKVRVF